ncbi:site-specific DNA recombinase [Aequitasia blattaphilus]|uniref:Recombinase family protein n=1 Tax=Aequitasia blattaphilus TaxID=2949332 RepID=A0ABT1ECK5_9FIRM|nr:recombinase family protein [Aequitasia blattaphilus]MCP1103557.1 recombinase family protein [Aequitasia blattaphilus]MCR8616197.1 recombinase family protein [Aequitasia blattaphilus]
MNGVIYARYSAGPGQTDQSIDGQLRDCMEYAKQNNITIIDNYIDRHISGTDFENRLEFNRLIKDAARNQFSYVIVWKIDRFGRNREEIAINKVKLRKLGVQLLYAKEHIPDGPEGIIMESLLEGMAEYYSAELAQKVKRGMRESVLKGHIVSGNPCFGYNLVNKKYEYNPETAKIVVEIFERYASGETAREIRDSLNERRILNAMGKPFNTHAVYYILRNEKYIGIYRYGDIIQTDVIPRIVPQELWDRVHGILKTNSRNRSKKRCTAIVEFLLTGKLFCGQCKSSVIGESGTGRSNTYYYYKCAAKKNRRTKCSSKNYRKEVLERTVVRTTIEDVLTDDLIEHLIIKIMELQKSDEHSAFLLSLKKQLKTVQNSIDNLIHAVEMGIITDSTKDRLVALEKEKEELNIDISMAKIKKADITENEIRYWLFSFRAGDIDDTAFSIRLINTFVNRVYLYDNYLIIVYNFTDGDGNKKAIEAEIERIEKDYTAQNLFGSDKYSPLDQAGIEPASESSSI